MIWTLAVSTIVSFNVVFQINCQSKLHLYGIFQNLSSLSLYNEALVKLNTTKADSGLYLRASHGLDLLAQNLEALAQNITSNSARSNLVFSDTYSIQNAILKEALLESESGLAAHLNQSVIVDDNLNGKSQEAAHFHVAESMLKFLDRIHLSSKEISLIVDNTEIGRRTLVYWIEKAQSLNIKVLHYKVLSKPIQKSDFSTAIKYGMNVFLIDCDGKSASEIFSLADDAGVAGIDKNIKWILTERTMDSLSLSCSLPAGEYYAIRPQKLTLNSSYIVKKVTACRANEQALETCSTTFNKAIKYKLWNNDKAATGRSWSPIQEQHSLLAFDFSQVQNPFLPKVRVAVADTPPWLSVANFSQDYEGDTTPCGRDGLVGIRNINGTSETVCFYGYCIDVLKAIEEKLHFVGQVQFSSDGKYGTYHEDLGKADGIVGDLASGRADLGLDLIEDKTRNRAIDFSTPYAITSIGIAYLQKMQYKESGIFRPFSLELWLGVCGTIAVLIIIVWVWERCSPYGQYQLNKRSLEDAKVFGLDDSANYIMGTFFTGEIIDQKPNTFGSHIAIIVISFVSILVIAAYSANLITFLVVLDEEPLVNGLVDPKLIGDSSTLAIGIQSSTVVAGYLYAHQDSRIQKMAKTRVKQFNTFDGMVDALKQGEIDIIISDYLSVKYAQSHDRDCSIKSIQLTNAQVGIALSFNKQSSWKRRFNLASINLVNSGKSDTIKDKWFKAQNCVAKNVFYSLDIMKMSSLFVWLSIGVLGCFFMFLVAFIIRCTKNKCRIKREC